jgi:hypothetical protein
LREITISQRETGEALAKGISGLPSRSGLGPVSWRFTCIDAQDLYRQLMELAQAMAVR